MDRARAGEAFLRRLLSGTRPKPRGFWGASVCGSGRGWRGCAKPGAHRRWKRSSKLLIQWSSPSPPPHPLSPLHGGPCRVNEGFETRLEKSRSQWERFTLFLLALRGGEGWHWGLNAERTEEEKSCAERGGVGADFFLIYSPHGSELLAPAAALRRGAACFKAHRVSLGNRRLGEGGASRAPRPGRAQRRRWEPGRHPAARQRGRGERRGRGELGRKGKRGKREKKNRERAGVAARRGRRGRSIPRGASAARHPRPGGRSPCPPRG